MRSVETLISKCITVSSLKGNTIGILERLDPNMFQVVYRIGRMTDKEDVLTAWENASTILLGVSTYQHSGATSPQFPKQLRDYHSDLLGLNDKTIILFGSGRSEYRMFCGCLDYLEVMLSKRNRVKLVYKFEGYPRDNQKEEFKNLVEEIINNDK